MRRESQPAPASAGPLSSEQLGSYAHDGYLVVRGLLDAGRTRALRAWTDEVTAWGELPGRHMMYFDPTPRGRLLNRIENFVPYHAGFAALTDSRELRGAATQLLGEPAVLFKDKINFKLPGGGGFEPHQDVQAGWAKYGRLHLTAAISIDRAGIDNGCLEVARGHHALERIGREWEPLSAAELSDIEFVPVESEPGDAVFFDSFVPHRSAPNSSLLPRRLLYVTYGCAADGDRREKYFADKRASYPPDIERVPGREYRYRV
jgi:hypothetical protein